jgi:hypothetical protein
MLSDLKYPNLIFGSYLDPFQVDLNCKYQGFLSIYKDYVYISCHGCFLELMRQVPLFLVSLLVN